MSLPTAQEITNRYLYGQETAPVNISDPSVVNAAARTAVSVNTQEYMASGAGRFVSAASFTLIREFFDGITLGHSDDLASGIYTKRQILEAHGYFDYATGDAVRSASVSFNNLLYGVDDADYAERTYIWGTVGFAIANDVTFIVNEDGSRQVENFSIVPLQVAKTDAKKEDFDFDGGIISDVGNNFFGLYDTIDPSRIGKTVNFEFAGDVTKTTLNLAQFNQLEDPLSSPSIPDKEKIWELTNKLFAAGSTRFLQDGKPIIYGSAADNVMEGDIANYDAIDFHMVDHRQLGQYVKNGIVYVAGDGNDSINATLNNDILLGGNGADTLNGKAGNDVIEGGTGADMLNPGTGFDRMNGGEGNDTYQVEPDFGNVIIAGDTDGGTISLLSGVQFRRVSGKENQDGLFAAVDAKGEWAAGKEGWSVSVSGGTAIVSVPGEDKTLHTIQIENFNIANNNFGMQLLEKPQPEKPTQSGAYEVNNGVIGQHNGVDVYLPASRSVQNGDDGLNIEQYRDTPLHFDQALYESAFSFEGSNRNDVLTGKNLSGNQTGRLDGRDGDDILYGEANPDSTEGNNDILVGGRGNDQIYGGGGDDQLYASEQFTPAARTVINNDTLIEADYRAFLGWNFTEGTLGDAVKAGIVSIENKGEKNFLDGGSGSDRLYGANYQDTLLGGTGNDFILAGAGQDRISGDDGDDFIYGDSHVLHTGTLDFIAPDAEQSNNSRAYFYQANRDNTYFNDKKNYNDVIDGGNGVDLVFGEIGNDVISGGAGDDRLFGDRPFNSGFFVDFNNTSGIFQHLSSSYNGDDAIDGGDGNDKIIGGGGSDHLAGGAGDDIVYGDLALDAYEYNGSASVGEVAMKASDTGWWGKDFIHGGTGNDALVGEGDDDVLDGGDGADQLYGDWMPTQVEAFGNTAAHTGNDSLFGGNGDDQLMGNSGDDIVDGGSGDDKLFGDSYNNGGLFTGTGNDVLTGGAGSDLLYGGDGNDTLNGGTGIDYLNGGNGDDAYIFDASGVDVIDDNRGRSTLFLAGKPVRTELHQDNAFIYLSEDGNNRIQMSLDSFSAIEKIYANGETLNLEITAPNANQTNGAIIGTQGDDTFVFSDAYNGQYALRGFQGNDAIEVSSGWIDSGYLDVNVVSDRWYKTVNYWVNGHYEAAQYFLTDYSLNNHANPAGTIKIYSEEWNPAEDIHLDSGDIVNLNIAGNDEHNTIYGKTGNDRIAGEGGNDTLYGAAGNDTLTGGSGADILFGESGNDILFVDESDTAFGDEGDDTFYAVANTGSGKVNGGAGADTFHIKAAEGSNFIITDERFDAGDSIQLDVNATDVHLYAGGVMLLSPDKSAEDYVGAVYLQDCSVDEFWDRMQGLSIRFADGQVLNADEIKTRASQGTSFSDYIIGDASDNVFHGLANADIIYGLAGNDKIYGDAGNDLLAGGTGNDIFYFGANLGNDMIDERMDSGWHGDADIIQFDSSVSLSGISLTHRSKDLLITLQGSGETLTLAGFLAADETNERNLNLAFSNGTMSNMTYIERELFRRDSGLAVYGTATTGINIITGSTASNYIYGDAGNDVIDGKNGNDWIDGGTGNDSLTGGSGVDTFRFGAGSGMDVIKDSASLVASDRVRLDFTTGINNLTIEVLAGSSEIKIGRHDAAGTVTDSVRVNNALGHLVDINNNEISVDSTSLLQLVNKQLGNRIITLSRNTSYDGYVVLSAADLFGNGLADAEKSRWQIIAATQQSGHFWIDKSDVDGDGNNTEESFCFAENLWNNGINYIGFLPSENAGNASFQVTLQRDDGLTLVSSMTVNTQSNLLAATGGNDIIDGGQSDTALVINALAGDDLVRDGYGDDVLHGDDGNDVLTHNWQGNGNDSYYGDAGNDVLDAGWGSDTMVGGSGNDLYIEGNLWSGDHTLIDNTTAATGDIDALQIGREGYGMWDYRSLWFVADGNDLLVNQLDALEAGEIRIKNWFDASNPEAKLDVIRVQQDDGNIYEAYVGAHFDALVQAMAGFAPPASVGAIDSSLADEYQAVWTLTTPMAA